MVCMVGIPRPPPPPVALWCWVVVLPGSVGLFASVLLVGVLCTPPPPLWPCGGPAVLAICISILFLSISIGYRLYLSLCNDVQPWLIHSINCS